MPPLECGIIFDGIPEGAISRKVGLIWGIPVYILGVEDSCDRLIGYNSSTNQDNQHDEDPSQVFHSAIAVGEPPAWVEPGQAESDP